MHAHSPHVLSFTSLNFHPFSNVEMLLRTVFKLCLAIGVYGHSQLGRAATVIHARQLANETEYDFIVAGGGVAGLTVADRLTENPNVTVLVIEYGPFDQREDEVMIPGAYFPVPYLWLPLMSTPQTALGGTSYSVPCGRVVGGGSVVNAMFFHRSDVELYDAWEELGATGWGWKDLVNYFKKSETFTPPDANYAAERNITWDESMHGFDGPVQASHAPYDYPGSANMYNGAVSLGIQPALEPNNGHAQGIFRLVRSIDPKSQTRSSARINRYDRDASRPNYHILSNTAVSRITFEGTTATGVEYVSTLNGTKKTVRASKEVIIAAGSVHTPQILQLSGIGDATHLKRFGIESISDLPGVGQNLQDHLVLKVNYNYTSNQFPNGGSLQVNTTYAAEQRALYDAGKPSAYDLTSTTGNLMIQLALSNWTNASASIMSQARSLDPAVLLRSSPHPDVIRGYKKQRSIMIKDSNSGTVGGLSWNTGPETSIYMTRPFSRGSININSTDILDAPLIDYGALTDPTDLEMLYAIYMKNRELMATPDMAVLGPTETAPAPGINDAVEIKERIKVALQPSNAHQCCTAAMTKRGDGGVVDPQNKVYGTERLSVVDASTWPLVAGGGPQASVYAGAEKAVDLIKARHRLL
ncbi:choline dehydrogenase-like protein [Clathrospora elynae]|uniref:Choline dehydrogenase-like protein n=1 Tax=Clathrospora elynae TaxID=706981 RepID=A0A6A5SVB5_9PLEO|nr:choline dehydrogenase-like protein [Clathrospora elynae]